MIDTNKVLVIGNKPYYNFSLSPVIDKFQHNIRCNFVVPGNNNGNLFEQLALCNHLYENFVTHPASLEKIINIYGHEYDLNYIHETYIPFLDSIKKYNNVFHAVHGSGVRQNKILYNLGCPFGLSKIPRTGMTVMLDLVAKNKQVYISNFSITDEVRHSYCLKKEIAEIHYKNEDTTCHSKEEIRILQWLHNNRIVDASMCLLQDKPNSTFARCGLDVSEYIKYIVESNK